MNHLAYTFPAKVEQGSVLLSCFNYYTVNKGLFHNVFSALFSTFLCSLLEVLLFKMVSKHSAVVVSSVPKHRKAVICFTKKMYVW